MAEPPAVAALSVLAGRMGARGRKVGSTAAAFGPHLGWLIQHNPHKTLSEILAMEGLRGSMTSAVASAEQGLLTTLAAGALAGRKLGITAIRKAATAGGGKPPVIAVSVPLSAYGVAAEHRARERMATALSELDADIQAAWKGVAGEPGSVVLAKARAVVVRAAVARWAKSIGSRSELAARGVARKAFFEVQLAERPDDASKTWHVTNPEPCPLCLALDGVTVGIHERFPGEHDVWWDGFSPLRHPRCGCFLSYGSAAGTDGAEELSAALVG